MPAAVEMTVLKAHNGVRVQLRAACASPPDCRRNSVPITCSRRQHEPIHFRRGALWRRPGVTCMNSISCPGRNRVVWCRGTLRPFGRRRPCRHQGLRPEERAENVMSLPYLKLRLSRSGIRIGAPPRHFRHMALIEARLAAEGKRGTDRRRKPAPRCRRRPSSL